MWELYEKSTEKLELNRVLELLADCGFLCEDFGDGTVVGGWQGRLPGPLPLQRSGGGPGASGANHGGLYHVCCAGFSRLL